MADSLQKIEEIGRQIDRRARLVKTAVESNLDTIMASQFALEVGYVHGSLAQACEKHFDTPKARAAFMSDVQWALERLMHRE